MLSRENGFLSGLQAGLLRPMSSRGFVVWRAWGLSCGAMAPPAGWEGKKHLWTEPRRMALFMRKEKTGDFLKVAWQQTLAFWFLVLYYFQSNRPVPRRCLLSIKMKTITTTETVIADVYVLPNKGLLPWHQLLREGRHFVCESTGKETGGKAPICLFWSRIWIGF